MGRAAEPVEHSPRAKGARLRVLERTYEPANARTNAPPHERAPAPTHARVLPLPKRHLPVIQDQQGLTPEEIAFRDQLDAEGFDQTAGRPQTRADCVGGPRPCPYVSCSHHLYLDVSESGSIKLNFPGRDLDQLEETCALDVAERGGVTLGEIGERMSLTLERVRQIEAEALVKLGPYAADLVK